MITADMFADTALLSKWDQYTYNMLDCQGFVEAVLKEIGVRKPDGTVYNWRGSNSMYRNYYTWRGTYQHIVSIGEIGIYKHKSERKYYVSTTIGNSPYYDSFGIGLKRFQVDFYMLRVYYMINKIVWFESFECEVIFREMFNLS